MSDTAAVEPGLAEKEDQRASKPEVGHQLHQFYVKTGGQTVGQVAEEVFGDNTPENRHHLWDWNRNVVPTPESTIPGGTIIRVAEPGNASGGPPLHHLTRDNITEGDLKGSSTTLGDGKSASVDQPKVNRAVSRDMSPGKSGGPDRHIPEGSSGAVAQKVQDQRAAAGTKEGGAAGEEDGFSA